MAHDASAYILHISVVHSYKIQNESFVTTDRQSASLSSGVQNQILITVK
jgi:hypothetical protein